MNAYNKVSFLCTTSDLGLELFYFLNFHLSSSFRDNNKHYSKKGGHFNMCLFKWDDPRCELGSTSNTHPLTLLSIDFEKKRVDIQGAIMHNRSR